MADTRPQVDPLSVRTSLLLAVGPAVFLLHFSAVYVANAIACARGFGGAGVPEVVLAATLVASVLLLLVPLAEWRAVRNRRARHHSDVREVDPVARRAFVGHLAARIALVALLGVWLVALPALFAQPCA
jgi:hypothetical protein